MQVSASPAVPATPVPATEVVLPERSGLGTVDELLRNRTALLARIATAHDLTSLARAMLLTVVVCGAAFGFAVGMYRGGVQIVLCAVKFPLAMLLATAVCAPVLTTLQRVVADRGSLKKDLSLVLSCAALASLVLASLTPLVLLSLSFGVSYHRMILVVLGCGAVAGVAALTLFVRSLQSHGGVNRLLIGVPMVLTLGLVATQIAWTLRPYIVRPRTPGVVIVRTLEGSLVDSIVQTVESSQGHYDRNAAPLPSEHGLRIPTGEHP